MVGYTHSAPTVGGESAKAERRDDVIADRPPRFHCEPMHAARRVIARQRGEVDAGHGLHEPRRLVLLLHRAPGAQAWRRGARPPSS